MYFGITTIFIFVQNKRNSFCLLLIPNKVDINWAHCASEDYSVSPLWIVNSLVHGSSSRLCTSFFILQPIEFMHLRKQKKGKKSRSEMPKIFIPQFYLIRIWDFQCGPMWGFNCNQGLILLE